MSERTASGPPPGWYPHPDMARTLRYWNGADWTGEVAPMPAGAQPQVGGEVSDTLQTIGWITAFVFPLAGFVIGCLCVAQGPKSEGWWMMVVSVIFAFVGVALVMQGAPVPA